MNTDNGWDASAEAWVRSMDAGEFNRTRIVDPAMLALCGYVAGLRVLDIGCGEGRFCRMLADRGALVTGLEPTEKLVTLARERHPAGEYTQGFAEALPYADASFDLVVSCLVLIDVPDFRAAIAEMARVCRPGGRIVLANLNAFATATRLLWARDEAGQKLHWTMDDYMLERAEWVEWAGIRIQNHHRPLSAYMQALLAAGLILEVFDEPQPQPLHPEDAATEKFQKEVIDSRRKPDFHVMRWRKPPVR